MSDLSWFGQPVTVGVMLLRILVAVFIGALIGIDREIKSRPAGMRTHVLVCVGAALVALIEAQTLGCTLKLEEAPFIRTSIGRLTAAVISGVGFLGAGTIFMADRKISGLTTAASLWCTACIGVAIGGGFILMGVVSGVIVLVVLRLMQKVVRVNTLKRLEVCFIHRTQTLNFLNEYLAGQGVKVLDVDFHAENRPEGNLYTNLYTLAMPGNTSYVDLIGTLSEHPNVRSVRTRNL